MGVLLVKLWDTSEGIAELGKLYLHNDVFATEAVACFDRAIAMRGDNPKYYNLRGVALSRAGERARAAADWETSERLAPHDPEPYVHRGVDALARGDTSDAIRSFELAIEKDPKHARAHGYLAIALERLGDVPRAFEHYDRSTKLAPDDPKVFCDRSDAHFRRGDYAAALKDAERAVRNENHRGSAYAARGGGARASKNWKPSMRPLQRRSSNTVRYWKRTAALTRRSNGIAPRSPRGTRRPVSLPADCFSTATITQALASSRQR